ncbi:MAG: DUF423 domain-containing protein [Planctomycetota bacterium]
MQANRWIVAAGVYGALGLAIGAFGAHGLPKNLAALGFGSEDIAARLEIFETGARYHMYAAMAVLGAGVAGLSRPHRAWGIAAALLLSGSVLFSGLLYALAFVGDGWRWLGAVVPVGGLLQIAGWIAIAGAGASTRPGNQAADPSDPRQ